ncbi:MAG TPA: hypothetical protein VMW16_04500 [Sedimentisphaerales bacterium]|nr:hypothetical protein [Sedimentisphaerales bacterium]
MKKWKRKYFTLCLFTCWSLAAGLSCSSCGVAGLVASPTRHERKIKAEYDLAGHKSEKMLVLVDQPAWLNAQVNLRYHLTNRIAEGLAVKFKMPSESLISYDRLSEFRSNRPDFAMLSPAEIGAALNAASVLLVRINYYSLVEMADSGYFKGLLSAECALFDAATGKKLWPEYGESKSVTVGFEVESRGQAAAVERLAGALTHCIIRYFYDCPEDKFKISEDRSDIAREGW